MAIEVLTWLIRLIQTIWIFTCESKQTTGQDKECLLRL